MMTVLLVPNNLYPESVRQARGLADWLDDEGVDVVWAPSAFADNTVDEIDRVDLVISLGGDGTLLRAARIVGELGIPILGLCYGHLGFLTYDTGGRDIRSVVTDALAGELRPSRRTVLEVEVEGHDDHGDVVSVRGNALNELALARGASGRMVEFDVIANGVHIDKLRGDGFVVATATGSTGYALSAGGPIVNPEYRGLVCVPIAPHTICARAFVTSPHDVVELAVVEDRSTDPVLFIDGEPLCADVHIDSVRVRKADHEVVLLGGGGDAFYESVGRVFYGSVR